MRCVIISGSPDTSVEEIKNLCTDDDFIVCADSGYTFARKAGLNPDLIIGDFDEAKPFIDLVESLGLKYSQADKL